MPVDEAISETTHRILGEEFEDYDPETTQAAAEEWVEAAPSVGPGDRGATFEVVETESGDWWWRLLGPNGDVLVESGVSFHTEAAARAATVSFKRTIDDAPVVTEDSV